MTKSNATTNINSEQFDQSDWVMIQGEGDQCEMITLYLKYFKLVI